MVHVSTPSIYFGHEPRINVKEDAELPGKPANEYVRTKLIAESRIDEASKGGLPVISIRPRAIFGPGDTALLPRLLDRLRKGNLPIIGDGKNLADLSFIDNVVDALLLCAGSPTHTLGRKYNITNGEPIVLWDLIKRLAEALGYACPKRHISYKSAQAVAGTLELIYSALPGRPEPPLTRYTAGVLGASMTLDICAARGDLGYQPRVSLEEGVDRVIVWWKEAHR